MKRTVLAGILWLLLFAGQMVKADQSQQFTLRGNIKRLKNGIKIYLIKDGNKDTIGVAKTSNGNFVFKGSVKDGTDFFYLRIDTGLSKKRSSEFLLTNKSLELVGDFNTWPKVDLKGSTANDDFLAIKDIWNNFKEPDRTNEVKAYIKLHNTSLYLPYVILNMKINAEERAKLYGQLSPEAKSSYFGKQLAENIDLERKRGQITEGSIIPDFKVSTVKGEQVSIRTFAAKSKYTLIDFWASWCKPCREEVPNLKKVYAAFKDKGFNIVGVALSDKEANWKNAISEDQTSWTHGRDVDNTSYRIFDIPAIPGFALIDQQGKLIAFNCDGSQIKPFGPGIRGKALYQSIEKLLGKVEMSKGEIKALKVGDKVPDIELGEILNHPTLKSAKVSDFKGRLLILDFWGTYCAVCIAQFPHMTELQEQFGEKIQILPVGFDVVKSNRIEDFIAKRKGTKNELKLPTIIEREYNSKFLKYFPQNSQPHEVWIDKNGIVIGITDHRAVIAQNIQAVLEGKRPNFSIKRIPISLDDPKNSFLVDRKQMNTNPLSAFSAFADSLRQTEYFYPQPDSSYLGRWINVPVYSIYQEMYDGKVNWGNRPDRRIITETKGKPFYQNWSFSKGLDNWAYDKFVRENLYCYEVIGPISYTKEKLKQYIINDLDQHFKIKSRIEKRKVKCLALVQNGNPEAKTNQAKIKSGDDLEYFSTIGSTTKNLCLNLEGERVLTSLPVIDETNYNQEINFLLPTKMGNSVSEINTLLAKIGFELKEVEREMNVLVLENMR